MMRSLFRWLNPWVIGGAIIFAVVMLASTLGLLQLTRQTSQPLGAATAVLNVIRAPTETPPPGSPTPDPGQTPSPPVPSPPAPGVIGVGAYVQITGTGGDGLRLRAGPGLEGEVRFLALESEVFQVTEGPQEVDGYTWWNLVAPYDEKVSGWAVSNYLVVVQGP